MVPLVEHAVAGSVTTIGLPVKFSAAPGAITAAAPLFGQHTREVLAEHGFSKTEIVRYSQWGAKEPARE